MDQKNATLDSSDRRQHERSPVTLVVDYDGADDLVIDYTENLSCGGVFLNTTRQFAVGTQVHLVLSFPGLLKPINITGTVRWTRNHSGGERGVGVEFDQGEGRRSLHDVVERVRMRDPNVVSRLIRILVVEDNPHVAQLIRNGLRGSERREFGDEVAFNFRTAGNGREALEVLRSEPFDAVIVDVYLPIMDGANLISQIRNDDQLCQLPIMAVSAGGEGARDSALSAGADFFLEKPMRLRQVVDTMRKLIDLGSPAG
ncbi:MAG: response regulator [Proteobacteria bacterium]|nr:response regulator [Pseudomonadota bacterium]